METVLLIAYIVLLVLQIVLLIGAARRPSKRRGVILFVVETVCTLGALSLMLYFDSLPGTGKAPGLTYFAETLYSLGAAIAYGVLMLLSAAASAVVYIRNKNAE